MVGALLGNPLIRLAMDACPTALLVSDPDGLILYVNRMFTRYTGYNAAEAVGRTPRILKSGNTPIDVYREMWATIRSGRPWRGRILNKRKEHRFRLHGTPDTADNTYWSHLSIAPIMGSDREILGYIAAHLDISEQVRIERRRDFERNEARTRAEVSQILQSAQPFHDRLAASLDALLKLDELHVQQRGGIFLYSADRKQLDLAVHRGAFDNEFLERESSIAPGACLCGRAALSGEFLVSDDCFHDERHEHSFACMTRHGHYIVPLRANGEVLGVMFLYTDPNPSRDEARIDMLRSVGDALGVAIANEHLTQRLITARDEAREASIAKGAFLANMSHEIRTPLTAILGFAEMLTQDALPEAERRDAAETVHRNANYLLEVVNDLLDLSKIEAGKLLIERVPTRLTEVLDDVIDLLQYRAHEKNLELRLERGAHLPDWILADRTRLRQVLVNLVSNAIKFTHEGSVRIRVNAEERDAQHILAIDVIDTGIGMSPEQTQKLFHPFVQADSSTTRRFGGTGLGLTISKRFAEMMSGDVALVSSQPGSGAHFRFTLPIVDVHPAADARSPHVPTRAPTPTPRALEGYRVLLAEDGPDNQRLIRALLERAGAIVTLAVNGEEAIDRATDPTTASISVILMDMQMPVIDGYTATRALRERGKRTPIIALTASAMVGTREACLAAGCDDFATKLIDRNALIETIRRVTAADQTS